MLATRCRRVGGLQRLLFRSSCPRYISSLIEAASEAASSAAASPPEVDSLTTAYRRWGHYEASLDPLGLLERPRRPELAAADAAATASGNGAAVAAMRAAYCGFLGAEFEHCESAAERAWWAAALESAAARAWAPSAAAQRNAARAMLRADALESFLARKYATLKRYGGEGCESMPVAVEALAAGAAAAGARELVIGQAHRGRLALLVGSLGMPARRLFAKLGGASDFGSAPGVDDVSSHLAHSGPLAAVASGALRTTLLPNPSHLEAVNPVVAGKVRAKRDAGVEAVALLIHGDAAVAGQGIVAECYAMAGLSGFDVGGTMHLITNNQVGFTALGRGTGRATEYASDGAKAVGAPVLHVNAEALREVLLACALAAAYRARFRRDVVVDLVGYRRQGHNEVDEPAFTQPAMYERIAKHPPFSHAYADALSATGIFAAAEKAAFCARLNSQLEAEHAAAAIWLASNEAAAGAAASNSSPALAAGLALAGKWAGLRPATCADLEGPSPVTGLPLPLLRAIGVASVTTPPEFSVHPRLTRGHVDARRAALAADATAPTLDWATAEALALGSVLASGADVRLVGQDAQRGTFSHRHAVLVDQRQEAGGATATPLNDALPAALAALSAPAGDASVAPVPGRLHVVSSLLSEAAVLGYEYGYSLESPRALCLWEAQFGDFANCAQSIIDTFVTSGESKWLLQSGLVLLLPHGFDGAGPEHSSARIERFLQLSNAQALARGGDAGSARRSRDKTRAEPANFAVVQPSTPAQLFHALRRQVARPFRKPLVVIAPKTLLRLPAARSPLAALAPGSRFEVVLGPPPAAAAASAAATRAILCSGQIYYALAARLAAAAAASKAGGAVPAPVLLRVEELAPFPTAAVAAELARLPKLQQVDWVQEEPANAGAAAFAEAHLAPLLAARGLPPLRIIARPALAAPAVGLARLHALQEAELFAAALAPDA